MTIKIPIDFDDVQSAVIDAGVYSAVFEKMSYLEAKNEDWNKTGKGAPQLQVNWVLVEEGELEGTTLTQWLSFSRKARDRMLSFFEAFGADFDEFEIDAEDETTVVTPMLEGAVCDIKVTKEPHYLDKNRKVNKVDGAPFVKKAARKTTRKVVDDDEEEEAPRTRRSRASEDDEKPARRTARTIR